MNAQRGFSNPIVSRAWFNRENAKEDLTGHCAHPLMRAIQSNPVTADYPENMPPAGLGMWPRGMAASADYANLHVKISFLYLPDGPWTIELNLPIALDNIGPSASSSTCAPVSFPSMRCAHPLT